jgi:hypothetical protein
MSSVLEKKMAMNTRLPPSLLAYDEYWEILEAHVQKWMLDSLNIECSPSIEVRKNIDAKLAAEIIAEENGYLIGESHAALPSAIWLSPSITMRHAAERLGDTPDRLNGTSPVFLRLICEVPTSHLLFKVSDWLTVTTVSDQIGDPSEVAFSTDPLDESSRYIQVEIGMHVDEDTYKIGFLVNLDRFLSLHAERVETIRRGDGSLGVSSEMLKRSVRKSYMQLEAVMERLSLTIADCERFTVGQEILLPDAKRHSVKLVAKTLNGTEDIAEGELGVWQQNRALKLNSPVSETFIQNSVGL